MRALDRPILGGENSVLNEVRRRVLATPVTEKLNLHLVIKSHGSPTAIHSQECEPASYAHFAKDWRALMAEFVEKGYRAEYLSFDLILHFCYSGNLKEILEPSLPFDTLIMNSAASGNYAVKTIMRDMFKRALPAYVAAKALNLDLCANCSEQELLYLLLNAPLAAVVRAEVAALSPSDRMIYDHLFFHKRFNDGMSPAEVTAHFNTLHAFPSQGVRDGATHDLLMLSEEIADTDELLAKKVELELARATPDLARLRKFVEYLQYYDTPVAVAACQRLLEVEGH